MIKVLNIQSPILISLFQNIDKIITNVLNNNVQYYKKRNIVNEHNFCIYIDMQLTILFYLISVIAPEFNFNSFLYSCVHHSSLVPYVFHLKCVNLIDEWIIVM